MTSGYIESLSIGFCTFIMETVPPTTPFVIGFIVLKAALISSLWRMFFMIDSVSMDVSSADFSFASSSR